MRAQAGEVYTVYNQYLKRYTACQVAYIAPPDTVSKESWAVILSLDWVGDAPLTAEELPHLRPLYKDFMYWSRDLHLLRVPMEVPPQYTLVGTLPPFTDQPCHSHSRSDQHEPFDSALELKALPCLSTLICERWHPDLLEFLQENPFVNEVTLLNHGQRTLDLRGTSIRKLMLDMNELEELWLCEGTELLLFQNKGADACAIHAPEDGSGLTLQFIGEYRPHTELPNLRGLHGIGLKDFDLTGLAAVHPHLKELRLWGAPGNLGNFSAVRGFRELTNLSTFDLFGFGADDIPTPEQMPELRWFWMTSLPETAAKAAKQFWKSKPGMDLRITKPRKPEWLAQNLDNPFRGWDGAEHIPAAAAKKAANQYRKIRSQLMKLAAEPGEDAQAQALDAVTAYTQTFNKMGFIETEERDEIYMALRGILDALPGDTLQKDSLIEKFDELRDF